jgi:hypothetical protein
MMQPGGGIPPGLAALIAAHQGGGGDADDQAQGGYPNDGGLQCLQDVITDFPRLLHELTAPADVQAATQALAILTKIQTSLMQNSGASGGPSPQQQGQ